MRSASSYLAIALTLVVFVATCLAQDASRIEDPNMRREFPKVMNQPTSKLADRIRTMANDLHELKKTNSDNGNCQERIYVEQLDRLNEVAGELLDHLVSKSLLWKAIPGGTESVRQAKLHAINGKSKAGIIDVEIQVLGAIITRSASPAIAARGAQI